MGHIHDWLHIGFANNGVKMYWVWIKTSPGSSTPVYEVTDAQSVPEPHAQGVIDQQELLAQRGLLQGPLTKGGQID